MDLFALEDVYAGNKYSPIYMQRKENTKSKKVITQANFAGHLNLPWFYETKYLIAAL